MPINDLLKLLKQAKEEAQHLPEPVRDKVRQEIKEAQLQVKETPQEKEKIAVKLNNAKDVLKAIAETVSQAVSVGNLLGNALIWLDKILQGQASVPALFIEMIRRKKIMGDEFKSGGGPMNAAKDQATILSNQAAHLGQNIAGSGNISSGSGNVTVENINIYAAGTIPPPKEKPYQKPPVKLGTLFGVPNLPPNYLERPEYSV